MVKLIVKLFQLNFVPFFAVSNFIVATCTKEVYTFSFQVWPIWYYLAATHILTRIWNILKIEKHRGLENRFIYKMLKLSLEKL